MKKFHLLLLLLFVSVIAFGQDKLIAIDSSGKLFKVDKSLEKKIKLFSDYNDFAEARLYQTADSLFYLEVHTGSGSNMTKQIKMLTSDEKEILINNVSKRIIEYSPNSLIDQSGKSILLVSNTLLGLYYYGPMTGVLLNGDSPGIFTTTALVSGGLGFIVPYLLSNNKEITESQAYASFYFQSRGVAYGWALPYLVLNPENVKTGIASSLVTSLAGSIAGYKIAKDKKFTTEHVVAMGVYGDYGMLNGLSAAHWLGFFESEHASRLVPLSFLASSAAGLIVGNNIAKKGYYTRGDASVLSSTALLGAYMPAAVLAAFSPENDKLFTFAASIGSIGGLYVGDRLAQKYDFSNRQGVIISLAELAGGLTGFGIGSLLNHGEPSEINAITAGLGALAGLYFMTKKYTNDKNQEDKNLTFRLNFNPMGLASVNSHYSTPMINASIRF